MNRSIRIILGLAASGAAGVLVALTLAASALAWSPSSLPPGWSVDHIIDAGATVCPSAYRIRTATPNVFSDPLCEDSPSYQHDFDAYVDAHYSPPATTTAPPATTATAPPASTATATTATTAATTTVAPPSATMTVDTTPAPAPAPVPTTTDTTTTLSAVEQSLQDQISALQAQLAALTSRVDRIAKAGDAAWLAFQQAVASGSDIPAAADIARGTYLDVEYALGAYA